MMDVKMVPRWGIGSRSIRGGGEEGQRLLHDPEGHDDSNEDFSERTRNKHNKGPRVRKAKVEDSYSDDEDGTLIPLGASSRPPRPPPVPDQCIEVDIQPGESLTSISLKYNVHVAELKRVNNLMTENEFFALKRIKIPVKPSSLLTELLPNQTQGSNEGSGWIIRRATTPDISGTGCTSSTVPSTPNSETEGIGGLDDEVNLAPLHNSHQHTSPGIGGGNSKNVKKAKYFLKNVDKDLKRIREKQEALAQSGSAVKTGNGQHDFVPLPLEIEEPVPNPGNGGAASKCGLLFVVLIVIAVLIILLIAKHETFELEELHHLANRNHSEGHHVKSEAHQH